MTSGPFLHPSSAPADAADRRDDDLRVHGAAIVYRLHDIGYEVDLDRAIALLGAAAPARLRPVRGEAEAIQIKNLPVLVELGSTELFIAGEARTAQLSARLFDFGVCSVRARVEAPPGLPWRDFAAFGAAVDGSSELAALLDRELHRLAAQLAPVIERPAVAPVVESYSVFRIDQLTHADGSPATPEAIDDTQLVLLLLNEPAALSRAARRDLLSHRFSYHTDELTVLTWDNALVFQPRAEDQDVEYVLEFANAQLLELRVYDALLDAEVPRMYDSVAAARRRRFSWLGGRFSPVLASLQARVADVTEIVERVENSLKLTEDVYLARVYGASMELFRATSWRRGIERKLAILRETYSMFNDEAQSARVELLELMIVLLIVFDIVLGLVRAH